MAVPLLLSEMDLEPLVRDPSSMDSAIDALEQSTIRQHEGRIRDHRFVDETSGLEPNTVVQLGFAADDGEVCGYQMFAEGVGGMDPTLPNARFITLLDPSTRQLRALVDYRSLSPLRVGATGGIAMRRLAPDGARVAAVLGSAQQARGQLQALVRTLPALERVRVYSPTAANREAFAVENSAWLGMTIESVATAREASEGADVIAVANASGAPILELGWIKPGALVVSIGGSRMPDEALSGPRIVSTTWDQIRGREPYRSAIERGDFSKDAIAAEIAEVIRGKPVRGSHEEIAIFELGVLGIWAVATAEWAYQWALQRGIGTPFTLSPLD
jgi:ornithine cyclodeaminase/alanine dehydrogenase-like protein (mu-crystallin family)